MYLLKGKITAYILTLLIVILPTIGSAQLYPLSNQYVQNPIAINPALAGSDDALSISLSYRNQWVGINGSPKTMTLAAHSPIRNDKIGLGLLVRSDSYGVYNSTTIQGIYAYNLILESSTLTLGLALDITTFDEMWNELIAVELEDEELTYDQTAAVHPNFSLGAYYRNELYYLGFSITDFLSNEWDVKSNKYSTKNDLANYNYFLYGRTQIKINAHLKFSPSLLVKYKNGSGVQCDFSPQLTIIDRISAGITYRTGGGIAGLIDCKINNQTSFAYNYEFKSGKNLHQTGGSHELMLKYLFKYNLSVASPR